MDIIAVSKASFLVCNQLEGRTKKRDNKKVVGVIWFWLVVVFWICATNYLYTVNYFSISRPMKITEMSFDRDCILTRPINFNLNYRRAKLQ